MTVATQETLAFDSHSMATLSKCGRYRYSLRRRWSAGATVLFLMLNPSKADATVNDPTIVKDIGFAKRWGYGELAVGNLFGWRSTDPDELLLIGRDYIGPDNDVTLVELARGADRIICAWGSHKAATLPRVKCVLNRLNEHREKMFALKLTKSGAPWHPLYVPYGAELVPFGRIA